MADDLPRWIEYRPIDELPGNPRNAKDHDNDLIGASLERFGVIESCVLDERTGLLVGGHGRRDTFLAAYAAGEEPPEGVVVADDGRWTVPLTRGWASADDLEADAAAVALNQVGPVGGWIDDKLADILGDLAAGPGLDGVGFDHDDLDDLLGNQTGEGLGGDTPGDGPDPTEPPPDPVSQPGDVWILGDHRLTCGDSTTPDVYPDTEAFLVIADPPYWRKVDEDWDDQWATFEDFLAFLGGCFDLWQPILAERGTVGVFCSADFVWHTEYELRQRFHIFNHIVWFKGHDLGQTVNVGEMRRFRPRSERLLLGETQHSPDALLAAFTAKTAHIAARTAYANLRERLVGLRDQAKLTNAQVDEALGTKGMAGHYFGASQWSLPTEEAWTVIAGLLSERGVQAPSWEELRAEFDAQRAEFDAQRREFDATDQLTDVWQMAAPSGDDRLGHAAAKPVPLLAKIIGSCSRTGDLVVDPFAGTAPSLIAAQNLGRTWWGIEKDPAFVDVICRRWQAHTGELPILEATGEPHDFCADE